MFLPALPGRPHRAVCPTACRPEPPCGREEGARNASTIPVTIAEPVPGRGLGKALLGRRIENPRILKGFSLAMAALLVWVAITIGYEHVWQSLASGVG